LNAPSVPFGAEVDPASLAVILVHGRGRSPEEMIDMARQIALPELAWVAPPAPGGSWYPGRFMDRFEDNQPALDQALARIDREVRALEAWGVPRRRIALIGFSQGACLISEYVYRNPGRWAALIALTGGLPGPEGTSWDCSGDLEDTPVYVSSGDADPWIPWPRAEQTAEVFRAMGGRVTLRCFPGREHLVCEAEIEAAREILKACQ
jgi:predicted esterase